MDKNEVIKLLRAAIETIDGMVDMQAMSSNWHVRTLTMLVDKLAELENWSENPDHDE